MTELERIAGALAASAAGGVPVLATLLRVQGSAYRGPGARMVVRPDDATVGAISGGCLEKDVVAHAARVRAAGTPAVVSWDLTGDDDAPWGLGMGCHARLDVLLEPCPDGAPTWLTAVLAAHAQRQGVVVGTLISVPRQIDEPAGARYLMVGNDGAQTGALGEGPLGGYIAVDSHRVMDEERSDVVTYPVKGGDAVVLHEFLARPIALVVCGDGPDTAPLADLGATLGWHVRTVRRDDVPGALDDRTAAVVMTHNYPRDLALLGSLLRSRARYIGVLGPRERTDRLLAELRAGGKAPDPLALLRLHAPVGLDIGADGPAEVALAIAAEIRAAMAGRAGGKLRERKGAIHDRR